MTQEQVIALMESSKTELEWDTNCDKVKKIWNGYYPEFWFREIIMSGLLDRVAKSWGGDSQIKIISQ